jgi:beta-lactamase class A
MADYSINYTNKLTKKTKKNPKIILLLIIFFSTLVILILNKTNIFNKNPEKVNSNISGNKNNVQAPVSEIIPSLNKLTERLEQITDGKSESYSIYVYDINNNKEYSVNGQMVITAASINKIPILSALYHMAGKGEINLEKIIVPQPNDIQNYGTGVIRYNPTGTPYSLKSLARLMMQKSDNTASYILGTQVIGLDKIQEFLTAWGLEQTDMPNNKSSAKDISKLLIKIYKNEITNKPLTLEMLEFMTDTDYEDRITKGLPQTIKFYHKTGDDIGKLHDVGIVDIKNKPYYIGIFTLDVTDEESTKKTMSEISKTVFEYMK